MFERKLYPETIENVIYEWNIITEYPDDKPFPSYIFLGFSKDEPIHVVAGIDKKVKICYIITVYNPDEKLWTDNFTKRRK